jgi:hypothetical protein
VTNASILALLFAGLPAGDSVIVESVNWLCALADTEELKEESHPSAPVNISGASELYGIAHALLALRIWLKAAKGFDLAAAYPQAQVVWSIKGGP